MRQRWPSRKSSPPPEAARLIPDGAIVTVSSSSALGCPDAVLAAIGARFDAEGHPRNITTLHPIAAGDMWGVKGIDHIAKPGCLARVLAGSYPSGPSSAEPPAIWKMISDDAIPAYNVPSGILFDMHREAAAKRPGVLTKVGMDTFVDPAREGCAMNARRRPTRSSAASAFAGEDWLFFPTIMPHVAIIRATTADERGNLSYEHEGGILGPLDQALAVRNNGGIVIAQVKRLAAAGTLRPHDVRGARRAGRRHRRRARPVADDADALRAGDLRRDLPAAVVVRDAEIRRRQGDRAPRRAGAARRRCGQYRLRHLGQRAAHPDRGRPARRRDLGDRAGRGRRRAAARLPVRLRLQRRGDRASRRISSPISRAAASTCRCSRSCRSTATARSTSPSSACGRMSRPAPAASSTSPRGPRRSSSPATSPPAPSSRFDDGALSIAKEGKVKKLVEAVEQISFSGPRAVAQGQDIVYVTERCVMRLEAEGVTVTEIAPASISKRDVLAQAEFPLRVAEADRKMDPALFHPAADRPDASAGRGGGAMSAFVDLAFEGAARAPDAQARRQAQRARPRDDRRAGRRRARDRSLARRRASRSSPARARRSAPAATSRPGAVCRRSRCGATGRAPAIAPSRRWRACAFPLIAALTGHAFGGGLELAAVADIRIAESGIKLGLPETGLGMAPGWSGTQRLVRRFGASVVRRMALGGRDVHRRGGAGARPCRRGDRAGRGVARAEGSARPTSPSAVRSRCRSSRR